MILAPGSRLRAPTSPPQSLSGCDGHICGERGPEAGPTAQGQAAKKPQRSPGRVSAYPRRRSPVERKLEAAAQRAHTGCRRRSGRPRAAPKEARIAPPAPERPNGRPVSLAPPRFKGRGPGRGGTARTGGGPGRAAAPGTQAPPPAPRELKGRGGERRSDALGPRLTLSATLSPACARALAQLAALPLKKQRQRRQQEAAARRRKDYAPDGPASRGSSAGRSPAAAVRDALRGGGGKGGTGDGERNANRPPPLPPSLPRSAARPLGFRPLPLPQSPGWSRRRLAAAWLRGMVLSGGQSPGARRRRPRPPRGAPSPSLPRTGSPCGPGPPPAFTRSPGTGGWGVIRLLCCHRRCRNRLRAPVAPALRLPGAWAVGAARGHRPREAAAVRAYLSPVLLRRGGGAVWRRHRWAALAVLPAAAASASRCCCCCRRGRCLRRGGGGAFPVRLR
ncbi:hypothetical protein AB1E18_007446 [Capra hircus]